MWRAIGNKFPAGPSEGLKRWSLGPLNNNPLEYFTKVAREYGDVAGLRVLNFKTVFINHPSLIEEVLVTNARKYSKGRVLRANRHVFGEGLLTSEGDFWLRQRRLAQPAFHRRSEEHTSELQSRLHLVCRLLLEKKKKKKPRPKMPDTIYIN